MRPPLFLRLILEAVAVTSPSLSAPSVVTVIFIVVVLGSVAAQVENGDGCPDRSPGIGRLTRVSAHCTIETACCGDYHAITVFRGKLRYNRREEQRKTVDTVDESHRLSLVVDSESETR